jgi:hypothetical protein
MPRYDDEHPLREPEFDWTPVLLIGGVSLVSGGTLLLILHFLNG